MRVESSLLTINRSILGEFMRAKETLTAAAASVAERLPDAAGVQLGTIVALLPDGTPQIEIPGMGLRLNARLAVHTTREHVETAITLQQEVVIQFEGNDPRRPIIIGFIQHLHDKPPVSKETGPSPVVEADVDGKRVRVTAEDEIVLQCGSASITLRRNGRVVVRGTYVETHSDGTNRIKGGQVQIN